MKFKKMRSRPATPRAVPIKKSEIQDARLRDYDARTIGDPLYAFRISETELFYSPDQGEIVIATSVRPAFISDAQRMRAEPAEMAKYLTGQATRILAARAHIRRLLLGTE